MMKKIAGLVLAFGFASLTWAQQIDLNKATEMELVALKGIGPVMTKEVLNERKKAPFKDWNDVTSRVKGIGMQKATSLSSQGVRVQGSAFTGKNMDKKQMEKTAKAKGNGKDMAKGKEMTNGKEMANGKEKAKASSKAAEAMVKAPAAKN